MAKHLQPNRNRRTRRTTAVVAGLVVVVMTLAACGSGTKTATTASTTTTPPGAKPPPAVRTYGPGVTATTVRVGITFVDLPALASVPEVTQIREHQQEIYQAYINDINEHGGVAGHKIVPFYKKYIPEIPGTAGLIAVCTALTDDDNVFATMGTYYDPSGDAQLCMAKQHRRVLVTFDLDQSILDEAPPGMIVTPGNTPERSVRIMLDLLDEQHKLKGKTIGIMGNVDSSSIVKKAILPELEKIGANIGAVGYLSLNNGTDTTTAESQLDSLIELWKTQHVDTVFISSKEAAAIRFVTKLRKALPNVQLLGDDGEVLSYGQGAELNHVSPNPYEGMIIASGPLHKEYENGPNWKYCKDIYKEQTGQDAPGPDDVIPYKNIPGKTLDTYNAINDTCQLVTMFRDIGNRVGKWLNNTNWVNTVNTFGPIEDMGTGQYASLHAGKYEADDDYRLVQFDSSLPPNGNWKALTPLEDVKN